MPLLQPCGTDAAQLEKEYAGKVRIVWKNYPLPFHNNAEPAAEAAMAAHAQGKFWQMHDKLFQNQQALDRAALDKYAQEFGLNMAKFKADMDASKYKQTIESEPRKARRSASTARPRCSSTDARSRAPTRSRRSRRSPTRSWPRRPARSAGNQPHFLTWPRGRPGRPSHVYTGPQCSS